MSWTRVSRTVLLLGDEPRLSLEELAEASRLDRAVLVELVESGALETAAESDSDPGEWQFPARSLELARSAARLREAFDLNAGGLLLAVTYRERIRRLEDELNRLRCLLGE